MSSRKLGDYVVGEFVPGDRAFSLSVGDSMRDSTDRRTADDNYVLVFRHDVTIDDWDGDYKVEGQIPFYISPK